MLKRFMEKHKNSQTLTPSECEKITISSARNCTTEIYRNPYTKTIVV